MQQIIDYCFLNTVLIINKRFILLLVLGSKSRLIARIHLCNRSACFVKVNTATLGPFLQFPLQFGTKQQCGILKDFMIVINTLKHNPKPITVRHNTKF